MKHKSIIIVIAKDREQFHNWLRELSPRDDNNFIFADLNSIRGARASSIIEIGNSYERKDYYELKQEALSRIY